MSAASTPDVTDRLMTALAPSVSELGLDLEFVEVTRAGKHSVLRVAVDKDGGVDMDDIADATRAVSAELDDSDLMGNGSYTLEVSSPGVDRPLTLPRHWRRNASRLVKVTFAGDAEDVTGRIVAGDEDGATLLVDDEEVRVAYADVKKAKVQIEFKPVRARSEDQDQEED